MGLDASVMCTCYKIGKTTPCPFPADFYIDEDGFPAVHIYAGDDVAKSDDFDAWLATCCQHPYMDMAALYIADWNEYRAFVDALEQVGWDHFLTLRQQLPSENHGTTPAAESAKALAELAFFKTQNGVSKNFLVNSDTKEIIQATAQSEEGLFSWDGRTGLRLGFDELGFFIRDVWDLNRELFRAMRIEQQQLASEELDRADQFEFTDLDTGKKFISTTPVRVFKRAEFGTTQEYPRLMHVEKRVVDTDYFDYILQPLTDILTVSVETGNPVRWS
ncbi:MAG: hypothetical protein GC179_03930 [Anaerolineaceae bacterium]|nr:hypothetical protein [Anaerolineaceae bacterium]